MFSAFKVCLIVNIINMNGDPKSEEFIYKKCIFILTCLNFSHIERTLHLMQYKGHSPPQKELSPVGRPLVVQASPAG